MRLTACFLLGACLQGSAAGYAQKITLTEWNSPFEKVLKDVGRQSGYLFLYTRQMLSNTRRVNLVLQESSLENALMECFKGQPVSYTIIDKTIVIKPQDKPANGSPPKPEPAPPIVVKGKVLNEKGEPFAGVVIAIAGTNNAVTTDNDGAFTLSCPDNNAMLTFSFLGYKKQQLRLGGRQMLRIVMEPDLSLLNEVVVSGYTVQKRSEFTGSSAHIDAQAVADKPVPSFDQALAGQATGVSITSNGGALNAAPVFRIRGINSIQLSSYPLIIIDGITAFTGDVGSTVENNPLADLNPNDIASIEVLKDASATAIYGSRAANGVVVITTKKGQKGKTKVTYDAWAGLNTPPRLPKLLNAEEYVMIKNEALKNAGSDPAFFLQQKPDGSYVDTKWYDYVYHTGQSQNHSLSISGANDATSYYISLGYTDQDGFIVKNNFSRKSARVNLEHQLIRNIRIGTNMTYSNSINNSLTDGVNHAFSLNNLAREVMVLPPNLSPFNNDGSYNIVGNSIGYGANTILTGYYNPLPMIEHDKYSSESNTFLGGVYLEWELVKGLKFKIDYSLNNLNVENRAFNNPYQAGGYSSNGSATNTMNKNRRTDLTPTLNYAGTIARDHNINILAGYEEIHTTTNSWGVTRQNLNDRYFETFEGSFANISRSTGSLGENGFRSYFGNLNYDYKKKYLLSVSYRRDGFSGLAEGHKYGNFAGGSLGWDLMKENFLLHSSLAKNISELKLRASYGQVGNINIGDFPSLSLYSSGVYGGLAALSPSQTGNADLGWETSKKTDIGLDISLLEDRFSIVADYYNNNIDGMILDVQQAPSKGIPGNSITSNVGSMYNRGFELGINAHLMDKGGFTWSASFNLSTVKNRVTALANNNTDIWSSGIETSNITRVGSPVGAIYVVKTIGVNPDNGLRMYINRNGETVEYNPVGSKWTYLDGKEASALDAYGDGFIAGSAIPTYYGGFNNNFSYKHFDLYIGFVYSGGNKMYNGTRGTLLDNRFFNNEKDILRRWTTPGQVTDIPKVVYNDQYASGSVLMHSANVEDGSYVKLKNVSLGYNFPSQWYSKVGISSLRIYASAGNFILYTKYTGSDPEISANGDSNTAPGRDKNSVPAGKTFMLGLTAGF